MTKTPCRDNTCVFTGGVCVYCGCRQCHELPDERCHWWSQATGPTLAEKPVTVLPDDHAKRREFPMVTGLLDYFPLALAEVARVSKVASEQHNSGEPFHWARDKSTDHANTMLRHLVDRGTLDADGLRHTAKIAWRALALLQEELERAGGKPGRASRWAVKQTIVADFKAGVGGPHTLRGSVAEKIQAEMDEQKERAHREKLLRNHAPKAEDIWR